MRCHRYGKASKKKIDEQEEQELMNDQAKRKTNIQVKLNCPMLMEIKEENGKMEGSKARLRPQS